MNLILLNYYSQKVEEGQDERGGEQGDNGKGDEKEGLSYSDHDASDNKNDGGLLFVLEASDMQSKHIIHHLKKTVGSTLRVGLVPNGPIGEAVVTALPGNGSVHLAVNATTLRPPPPKPLVRILLGVPYPKVILALWPVMTSLGVEHVIYAPAALTEPAFCQTSKLSPAVYEPLLRQGLAQAQDTQPPRVTVHDKDGMSVLDLLGNNAQESQLGALTANCCKIVLHVGGDHEYAGSIRQGFLRHCHRQHQSSLSSSSSSSQAVHNIKGIFLAIGPERGWTDEEANAFAKAGFVFASLGAPILRTDTAAIAALALARDILLETEQNASTHVESSSKNGKRKMEKPADEPQVFPPYKK